MIDKQFAEDRYRVAMAWEKSGVPFLKHLSLALRLADNDSAESIRAAFREYWGDYLRPKECSDH